MAIWAHQPNPATATYEDPGYCVSVRRPEGFTGQQAERIG